MKRIADNVELLAPVGYKDALKAAIIGGADAVYLGGKDFGARRLAENFDDGEMRSAIKLAHDHHVKVYVTVNTLIKESELETAASATSTCSARSTRTRSSSRTGGCSV